MFHGNQWWHRVHNAICTRCVHGTDLWSTSSTHGHCVWCPVLIYPRPNKHLQVLWYHLAPLALSALAWVLRGGIRCYASPHISPALGNFRWHVRFFVSTEIDILLISLLNFQQVLLLLSMLPSLQQNPPKKGKVRRLGANYTPSHYTSSSRNESCFGARLPARTDPRRAEVAAFRTFGHLYCSYFEKPAEAQSRKYSSWWKASSRV
jgi:hypothetical protein